MVINRCIFDYCRGDRVLNHRGNGLGDRLRNVRGYYFMNRLFDRRGNRCVVHIVKAIAIVYLEQCYRLLRLQRLADSKGSNLIIAVADCSIVCGLGLGRLDVLFYLE